MPSYGASHRVCRNERSPGSRGRGIRLHLLSAMLEALIGVSSLQVVLSTAQRNAPRNLSSEWRVASKYGYEGGAL